jgi:hypothetical protein
MLPAMLLHVIEAPRPIDFTRDFARCDRRVQNVSHALFFVDHLDNTRATQRPGIERLAA